MKKILSVSIMAAAVFIIGCASAALLNAPAITSIVIHEASVTITWEADASIENLADFGGYNVYVSADSSELLVEDAEDLDKITQDLQDDGVKAFAKSFVSLMDSIAEKKANLSK